MGIWHSIAVTFGVERWRSRNARVRLITAYQNLFSGKCTETDAEIVLADLVEYTSHMAAAGEEANTSEKLWRLEGRRDVMQRIMDLVNLPPDKLRDLRMAIQLENEATRKEGKLL